MVKNIFRYFNTQKCLYALYKNKEINKIKKNKHFAKWKVPQEHIDANKKTFIVSVL